MKQLLTIALLVSLAFSSCTKEDEIVVSDNTTTNVTPNAVTGNTNNNNNSNNNNNTSKKQVTVEVTSDNNAFVEIQSVGSTSFTDTYRKTFSPTQKMIVVKVTSDVLSTKSIAIYVGDELVALRRASCAGNEYELTYELESL